MRSENGAHEWHQQKTYDSLITYGLNAIKFVLIANGGAILALLTFIGNHEDKIKGLQHSMIWFVSGVIVGGTTNTFAYLTQYFLFNQRQPNVPIWRDHRTYLYLSMILIMSGILCFSVGALTAVCALKN